jgi:hypothetical protein
MSAPPSSKFLSRKSTASPAAYRIKPTPTVRLGCPIFFVMDFTTTLVHFDAMHTRIGFNEHRVGGTFVVREDVSEWTLPTAIAYK